MLLDFREMWNRGWEVDLEAESPEQQLGKETGGRGGGSRLQWRQKPQCSLAQLLLHLTITNCLFQGRHRKECHHRAVTDAQDDRCAGYSGRVITRGMETMYGNTVYNLYV